MHRRPVDATGDDLHRVGMPPVGTDGFEPAVMCQEHPVPAAEGVVGQRFGVGRVDVDHHLCDALFPGLRWRIVRAQTELTAQGGLHAGPVQHLAFDGAGPHRLFTQKFDAQPVAFIAGHMADGAENLAG